jgi:hypothetical protein
MAKKRRKKVGVLKGYIVVSETLKTAQQADSQRKGEPDFTGVIGLARLSLHGKKSQLEPLNQRRRWVSHNDLNECFVHSKESILRGLRGADDWTRRATHVHEAVYDRSRAKTDGGGYAEQIGPAMAISAFRQQLAAVA